MLAGNEASVEVMRPLEGAKTLQDVGVVCSFLFYGEDFERSEPTCCSFAFKWTSVLRRITCLCSKATATVY